MLQLGLFEHAPRHYHEALARLGRLDLPGCRTSLAEHCRTSPAGPDPIPVEEAAAWLEARLPADTADHATLGRACLSLCRDLREGRSAPHLLVPGGELTRKTTVAAARLALRRRAAAELPGSTPLGGGLPWAAFDLLAGNPDAARTHLATFQGSGEPTAAAYLALAEACNLLGRAEEAARAWREGYGIDPSGQGWGPMPKEIVEVRAASATDPLFPGDWWAVAAYLEGRLPRWERARPELLTRRLRRFREGAAREQSPAGAPALFFAGLFLSEHGSLLPLADLAAVRRTLRTLHPEAYGLHMEFLETRGLPPEFRGREYIGW